MTVVHEWNAADYHRVSTPQFDWGMAVLDRLPLRGDELLLDVGCGTGRLTEKLLDRLPHGHVVGIDLSFNMLGTAHAFLRPRFGSRISLMQADASRLPVVGRADAIFSTATFHWVLDHPGLFRSLFAALKPGGRLFAQCGGGPNIERIHRRAGALTRSRRFAALFATWREPWEFADAPTTEQRLVEAGFEQVDTSVVPAPVVQPNADAFRSFITTVICRPYLAYLSKRRQRDAFIERLTALAANDNPPFELDYWRLNMAAFKPFSRSQA